MRSSSSTADGSCASSAVDGIGQTRPASAARPGAPRAPRVPDRAATRPRSRTPSVPSGPDQEVEHVARGEPGVERVARRVLAGAREPRLDQLGGGAHARARPRPRTARRPASAAAGGRPRRSSTTSPSAVTSSAASTQRAHAAVAHASARRRHWWTACRRAWPSVRSKGRAAAGARPDRREALSSASVTLAPARRAARGPSTSSRARQRGEVDDERRRPRCRRPWRCPRRGAPAARDARTPSAPATRGLRGRCGTHTAAGQDPEDPGALGIGGTCAMVGSVEAPDRRGRQHAEKVTILFPYAGHPARAADPHRRGPSARPRVGRVGRQAAAQPRELRLARRRCSSPGRRGAPDRASALAALALFLFAPRLADLHPAAAPAPLDRARCPERDLLWALVGRPPPFLCDGPRAPARAPRRARAVPAPHAAHLAGGRPVRPPRLGRECGGEGLQRAGAAAAAGRSARASCCC